MRPRIVFDRAMAGFALVAFAASFSSCSKSLKKPSEISTAEDWVEVARAVYSRTMGMAHEYIESGDIDSEEAEQFARYINELQEASSAIFADHMKYFLDGWDTENLLVRDTGRDLATRTRVLLQGCYAFVYTYFVQIKDHPTLVSRREELVGRWILDLITKYESLETTWRDLEGLK